MKHLTLIIRNVFTVILLVFVWRQAEWAVALSITMIYIAIEANAFVLKKILQLNHYE